MSATVTDDSFLVKGLGIDGAAIKNPLVHKDEKWSGEKMVLIPSLIDAKLTRENLIARLAKPVANRKFGVVVLSPSFDSCKDWGAYGAIIAKKEDIDSRVQMLRERKCEKAVVIVNRYDGIDLPDDACRILVIDMKPHPETLMDRYVENCRSNSEVVATKIARTIEQGMGRGVRGEKDYCVILILGPDLARTVRSKDTMKFLSPQSQIQIQIGIEVAQLAKDEISKGVDSGEALIELLNQCLKRDAYWKEYYTEQMDKLPCGTPKPKMLDLFSAELAAEQLFQDGRYDDAVIQIQKIINEWVIEESEKAWYLQEIARYLHPKSKAESNKTQIAAHQKHRLLLKPKSGMTVAKLSITSQRRIENMIAWIRRFDSHEELAIAVDDITSRLRFHVEADKFEKALDDFGKALGFECQRPDKEWKEGPDNLWALRDGEYFLIECKSEAALNRAEVYKDEAGQMHNACSWFDQNYPGAKVTRVMIIPTLRLGRGAAFTEDVRAIRKENLAKLVMNSKAFFSEFKGIDLKDLSETKIQELINLHNLSVDQITGGYSEKFKPSHPVE